MAGFLSTTIENIPLVVNFNHFLILYKQLIIKGIL